MKRFLLFVLLFTFQINLYSQNSAPYTFEEALIQADKISKKVFDDGHFPGMAVAVSYDGIVLWEKGYGYANVENQIPVDPKRSLFRIGSVSKTITSAGLAKLVMSGRVQLKDTVQRYVPDFPTKKYTITVEQVAGHIAGIRHYRGTEFMNNIYYPDVKSGLKIFDKDPLLFEPGSKYSYSSYGWNLISAIIEKAGNQPFLEYMQNNVFDVAEMRNIHPERRGEYEEQKVSFYVKNSVGQNVIGPMVDNSYKWAGGGFVGTADDLLKFGFAVLNHKLMNQKTFDLFTTPLILSDGKSTNYGIGWRTGEDKKGRNWVGHSGGSVGGSTMFLVYPDKKLVVTTLVNLSSARTNDLAWRIAEQFLSVLK